MKKFPQLEEDEKRKILQNAAKVNLNRTVNVDSYLANQLLHAQPKSSYEVGKWVKGCQQIDGSEGGVLDKDYPALIRLRGWPLPFRGIQSQNL